MTYLLRFVSLDPVAVGAKELVLARSAILQNMLEVPDVILELPDLSDSATIHMIDLECSPVGKSTTDTLSSKALNHLLA